MFHVSMKKGSAVTIPIEQGWTVSASSTGIVGVVSAPRSVTLTALAVGQCTLILQLASDVSVSLDVGVTT